MEWTGDGCKGREWAGDGLEGVVDSVDNCSSEEVWFRSGVGEAEMAVGLPASTPAPFGATGTLSCTAEVLVMEGWEGTGLSPPLTVSISCLDKCGGGKWEGGWEAVCGRESSPSAASAQRFSMISPSLCSRRD